MDAIANLVMATASDRGAIAKLMAAVARLTTELATVNTKLFVDLQTNYASQGGRGGHNRNTRRQGAGDRAGSGIGTRAGNTARIGASAPAMAEGKDPEPLIHYCCRCGCTMLNDGAR